MIEIGDPGTAGWCLLRLGKALEAQIPRYNLLENYRTGNHPLPQVDDRYREKFNAFQKRSRTNYTGLVVESLVDRLRTAGFRTGGKTDPRTDDAAWATWQANSLDAEQVKIYDDAATFSISYTIVGPPDARSRGKAIVTVEDPREVIHETDPLRPRRVRAALKAWFDDTEQRWLAIVYLEQTIHYFRGPTGSPGRRPTCSWEPAAWEIDTRDSRPDGFLPNLVAPEVPVVPFVNRPNRKGWGKGEFEDVIDIQDRINDTIINRSVISWLQAYRQRWGTGVVFEDEDGRPVEPFVPGVDMFWHVPAKDAKFGDFDQADLTPLLSAIEADVMAIVTVTRTPPHYLLTAKIDPPSGASFKAAETGLVTKARNRQTEFGESLEQQDRLCAMYENRPVTFDGEVIWEDPESRTLAELADSSVKLAAAGVPWRTRMERLGYSPQQIDRMDSERTQDALIASLQQPQLTTPVEETPASADT